jgi:hypothetical protein
MRMLFKCLLAGILASAALPARAQEVVVTGQYRAGYTAAEPYGAVAQGPQQFRPVVNLKRTADYIVQAVRVVGDTREAPKRRDEVLGMVRNAIQLADRSGVELSTGELVLEPLTLANYTNLPLRSAGRPDTDQAIFLVKTRLAPGIDARAALDRITKFVAAVPNVARAEMETMGDPTLSVIDPNQYRGQIIALIAADAASTAGKFGTGYGIQATGLDRPVQWARASLTEVFLYLPASYVVVPKP